MLQLLIVVYFDQQTGDSLTVFWSKLTEKDVPVRQREVLKYA